MSTKRTFQVLFMCGTAAAVLFAGCGGVGPAEDAGDAELDGIEEEADAVEEDDALTDVDAEEEDPCAGIEQCEAEGRTCDGDVLVVCAPDAFGCLVETRTNCTETDEVCDPGSDPVSCVDPCTLVEVCPEAVYCDGNTLVTCDLDEHGCPVIVDEED